MTTLRGALKCAMRCRTHSINSASVTTAPARTSTKAQGVSPHFGSGCATTAASSTEGCSCSVRSTWRAQPRIHARKNQYALNLGTAKKRREISHFV
eukprot:4636078-Pleurochrysis_carterae.AAC.2